MREGKIEDAIKEIGTRKGEAVANPTAKQRSPQLKAMEQVLDRWLSVDTYVKMREDGNFIPSRADGNQPHDAHALSIVANMAGRDSSSGFDMSAMTRDTFKQFVDTEFGQARLTAIKEKVLAAAERHPDRPYDAAIAELARYQHPDDRTNFSQDADAKAWAREALERQTNAVLAAPQPTKDHGAAMRSGVTLSADLAAQLTASMRHVEGTPQGSPLPGIGGQRSMA